MPNLPTIPGYALQATVGRGGMGRVYRARDLRLGRTVAIKMLVDGHDADLERRFEEEARAVAALTHPQIARLYEFARTPDGQPFCVMEFLGGGSLAERLDARPLAPRNAAEVIRTLAEAMEAAHRAGILHRDLKPSNILLTGSEPAVEPAGEGMPRQLGTDSTAGGTAEPSTTTVPLSAVAAWAEPERHPMAERPDTSVATPLTTPVPASRWAADIDPARLRIADFGLARRVEADSQLTHTGQILGTPAYMAPEQASGFVRRPSAAVDVYALGAMLYELLTGRPPFLGGDAVETIMLLLSEDPLPPRTLQPGIPHDLQTICLKCLDKRAARRYQKAAELADDLTRFLEQRPILAKPATRAEICWKWMRRNPWKAAALGLLTGSAVAATAGLVALQRAYAETQRANTGLAVAVEETNQAFSLTQEALDRIVNRLRDDLYEVPQATEVMRNTTRDSLELHRRLYALRPHDLQVVHGFVNALQQWVLVEWLHGSRETAAGLQAELQERLSTLTTQFPHDARLAAMTLQLDLDRSEPAADGDQGIGERVAELLQRFPTSPDVARVASLAEQQAMTRAANAGDLAAYRGASDRRVAAARNYRTLAERPKQPEAGLWLTQALRAAAEAEWLGGQLSAAAGRLTEAEQILGELDRSLSPRMHRSQAMQLGILRTRLAVAANDWAAAESAWQAADRLGRQLVADFPDDQQFRYDWATVSFLGAQIAASQNRFADADTRLTDTEAALAVLQQQPQVDAATESLMQRVAGLRERIHAELPDAADANAAEPNEN